MRKTFTDVFRSVCRINKTPASLQLLLAHLTVTLQQKVKNLMGSQSPTAIYVYSGKGSCREFKKYFLESLNETVDPAHHYVEYITPKQIKEGSWVKTCKVIAFGGGYDRGFEAALGKEGARCIREFVHSGGSYLGMCAGAYWACDHIEFDKNGPLEVVGERFLKFYPGLCIGPAFPGFQYDSKRGVHAVPVSYTGVGTVDSYMQGGGYFVPYTNLQRGIGPSAVNKTDVKHSSDTQDHQTDSRNGFTSISDFFSQSANIHESTNKVIDTSHVIEVLGTFDSLPNRPAAIVKCTVGHGKVILSGIHLEFSVHYLNKEDPFLQPVIPKLLNSEAKRLLVFKNILGQLGVKCTEQPVSLGEEDFTDFLNHPGKSCDLRHLPRPVWNYSS